MPKVHRNGVFAMKAKSVLADDGWVGPWSEESAAFARSHPGVVIGEIRAIVDGSDPVAIRAALNNEVFGDLISDEGVAEICRLGRGHELLSPRYATFRYGIDKVTYPCVLLAPTIEELEALEDKEQLALIIRDLNIRGTSPRIKALILSTIEPNWSWIGEMVQDHLVP